VKRLFLAALLAGASFQAHAIGRIADVSVINRDTGSVLPVHFYHGEYWVAGAPGARYAITVRNRSGERVLTVAAVDGVNVISGETASWSQTGYVLDPWSSYDISGWRKSNAEVAAFEFSAASGSYAALTGRPANVGVIGVAVFRERIAPPAISQLQESAPPIPNAPKVPPLASSAAPTARMAAPAAEERLGTGHGRREDSHVVQVDFERLQSTPNEVIRIRYDSLPNLIALGVIRPTPSPTPVPSAFPGSPVAQYVPDPPEIR
jgi:hypothetical protein